MKYSQLPNLIETQSIHRRDGLNDCAGKGLTLHCARKERAVLVEDRISTGYPCAVCADAPSSAAIVSSPPVKDLPL